MTPSPNPPSSARLPPSQLTSRIVSELARAVWRYRKQTVLSILLMVAAELSAVLISPVLKHIVDEVGHPVSQAVFPVFLVLAYALLRFLGDALNEARDVVFSIVT